MITEVRVVTHCDYCSHEVVMDRMILPPGWIAVSSDESGMANLCSWRCVRRYSRNPLAVRVDG